MITSTTLCITTCYAKRLKEDFLLKPKLNKAYWIVCCFLIFPVCLLSFKSDLADAEMDSAKVLIVREEPMLNDLTALHSDAVFEPKAEINTEVETEIEPITTEVITEATTQEAKPETKISKISKTKSTKSNAESSKSTSDNKSTELVTTTTTPVEDVTEEVEPKIEDATEVVDDAPAAEDITEAETEVTTEEPVVEKSGSFYSMSKSELRMFAALVYIEAGNESYKCQLGVASVVMNLMLAEGKSLKSCIYTPGRFTVASRVGRTTPSDTSIKACQQIIESGPIFPRSVKCFRNNHYFSWATPYTCIDNVYFSSY